MNIIEMSNISKHFPINNTQALYDMHLSIKKGEIHAIVGENGAGKSTLMKILHNTLKSDSGTTQILGSTGMVSQHFKLVEELSILDNIIMGKEPTKFGIFIDRKRAVLSVNNIIHRYNFVLDISRKVRDLSIGQKQLVEIIKVIYNNSDILIFDEPTAILSDSEVYKLRKTIKSLKDNGKTVIIISHKIKDISSISDRFTIMRHGRFTETVETQKVNLQEISQYMSGTDIVKTIIETDNQTGEPIFSIDVAGKNVEVNEREIVGITGYSDCGIHELESKLESISLNNPNIGYVPSDRLTKGVGLDLSLKESLIAQKRRTFSRYGFLEQKKIDTFSDKLISRFHIKGSINSLTGTLSGGNIQKSVLARVLEQNPETLILCSPTWGIDLKSSNNIYTEIKKLKDKGRGILLLSSDIDEILKLSNRIFVMYKGKIVKELNNSTEATKEVIGQLASGVSR